jgi:hypothetical protein
MQLAVIEYQLWKEQSNCISSLSFCFIDYDHKWQNDWELMSETMQLPLRLRLILSLKTLSS